MTLLGSGIWSVAVRLIFLIFFEILALIRATFNCARYAVIFSVFWFFALLLCQRTETAGRTGTGNWCETAKRTRTETTRTGRGAKGRRTKTRSRCRRSATRLFACFRTEKCKPVGRSATSGRAGNLWRDQGLITWRFIWSFWSIFQFYFSATYHRADFQSWLESVFVERSHHRCRLRDHSKLDLEKFYFWCLNSAFQKLTWSRRNS